MERRHEDLLRTRLEEVISHGYTTLLWSELYLWFQKKRLTKNDYQEVVRIWEEVSQNALGDLKMVKLFPYGPNGVDSGRILFAGARVSDFSDMIEL